MPDRLGSEIDEEHSGFAPASPYPLPRRSTPDRDSAPATFLQAVPMFAGLSEPLRRQIAAHAEWIRLEAGEWLFREGDAGDSLYVVRSGRLEVVVEEPRPVVVRALTRGAVVGELALLTREPRSASVRARRDCELLRVSSTDFAELLSHERRFSLALMRELGRQLRVSRGLEPPDNPLPATIAIVQVGGEPAAGPAERLRSALAEHGSVALLDEAAIGDETAYGAGLDRAERDHERVLLAAGGAGPWAPSAYGRPTGSCWSRAAGRRRTTGRGLRAATSCSAAPSARRSRTSGCARSTPAPCTGSNGATGPTRASSALPGGWPAGPLGSCFRAGARGALRTSACSKSCWMRASRSTAWAGAAWARSSARCSRWACPPPRSRSVAAMSSCGAGR